MLKKALLYFFVIGSLIFSLFFLIKANKQVIQYTKLTDESIASYNSFQNLSKDINNAAVVNPNLIKASNKENSIKLFYTDSQTVVKQMDTLLSIVKDSENIKITEDVNQLLKQELLWILASNVPDSIVYHNSSNHLAALQRIDSLINSGIQRSAFLKNYYRDNLNSSVTAEQFWMALFIALLGAFIFYFGFNLYRQKSRIRSIEENMSTIFNRITDGIISLDNNWHYTFVNDTSARLNGKKKNELVGQLIWDIHPAMKNTPFWNVMHEAKMFMEVREHEFFSPHLNSWFALKIYPSDNGITIYYTDITQRKLLVEQQNLLLSIIDSSEDAIISKTLDGIVTSWNRSAETIFGYSQNEILGKSIRLIIPPDLQNEEDKIIGKIKVGELVQSYETERIRKDGQRINISLSVSSILDIQGNITGASKIARDITQHKKAEEKLALSKKIFLAAFLKSPTGITIYRVSDGVVIDVNEMFCKITEFNRDELIGQRASDLNMITIEERAKLQQMQLEAGGVTNFELVIQTKYRNPINILLSTTQLEVNNELCQINSVIDITQHKIAQKRLIELNDSLKNQTKELERSNAELEQFAYVASHDLQEPLRMISSFLTQLEKKYAGVIDEKGKTYIGFAVDGAKRMRQIILDLLDFSRVGKTEDKKENLDINSLVKEVSILFRKLIEDKKATIETFELPVIYTYQISLYQVFQNLIGNALKYAASDRLCKIEISATDLQTHWQFSIADNGIGINEEFFDKIFVIFQRLHNKDDYSGTGMGLAITKKIINNLGGKIWVTSEEGKGSTFYFTIKK